MLPAADRQKQLFEADEIWQRMEATLKRGLHVATTMGDSTSHAAAMDDELRAGLQAVYLLAPPAYGAVETTEISGRLIFSERRAKPVMITRDVRSNLRQRLRLEAEGELQIVSESGFISELDREEATCRLRDADGNTILKLWYEDPFFDEVKEAFDSQRPVTVIAGFTPPSDTADVLAVTFLHANVG